MEERRKVLSDLKEHIRKQIIDVNNEDIIKGAMPLNNMIHEIVLKNGEEIYIYYNDYSDCYDDCNITLQNIADELSENKKVSRYIYFFVRNDYGSFSSKQKNEQINNVTFFFIDASNYKNFILRDQLVIRF